MIMQRIFHTYKEDFPLLSNCRLPSVFKVCALDNLLTSLIIELSDLTSLPRYSYIARHTNDKIPEHHLGAFLRKFQDFVDYLGRDQPYNIPTVWFVGYFEAEEPIDEVRRRLDQKGIKYFEDGGDYDSFEAINQCYWDSRKDAQVFPKFLNQVTMIGIDLLSVPMSIRKLKKLECLEWLQYKNKESMKCDLKELRQYLNEKSPFYREHIEKEESQCNEFWANFTKVKKTDKGIGSWPHFLFNICGASSSPMICD
jgi:hypothetical protein